VAEPSTKDKAWIMFDRILADAAPDGDHTSPWHLVNDNREYGADLVTLERLLGVPLALKATVTSGVPALALDVWLSYELRRAGFAPDATWPRGTHPRIIPRPVLNLLESLPRRDRAAIQERLERRSSIKGVTQASASILGKNYLKQVDVIMTDWATGPEVLISTKRMDSSYGKNAPNRIEESYGDAKNLRQRHPLAALGFLMGLRSDILVKDPLTFDWLVDLVGKLGQEDDAYHATCLLLIEYGAEIVVDENDVEAPGELITTPGAGPGEDDAADELESIPDDEIAARLATLPTVRVLTGGEVPSPLDPSSFLATIVNRTLDGTPITMHREARARRRNPV
jgi:hypothetical protein